MKGGNRELRRDIIAFGEKMTPYDLYTEEPLLLLKKIKCILNKSELGDLRIAFKDESGNKQIHLKDKDRLYLKLKRMKIEKGDEAIYEGIWAETGVNSEPRDHHFLLLLLCVKGVFKEEDKDLELVLADFGIRLENRLAKFSLPDPIHSVFREYIDRGIGIDWGYPSLSSVKTKTLSIGDNKEKIFHLLEILVSYSSHFDFNQNKELISLSETFSSFIYDLICSFIPGEPLEEALRRYASRKMNLKTREISQLLYDEYMYFKDNKPKELTEDPCLSFKELLSESSVESSLSPLSATSPVSEISDRTVVGVGNQSDEGISDEEIREEVITPLEECLRGNPCLKLIFDELKGEDKGAIKKRTKRKKSSKKKRKKRNKSLKDKKNKRRTKRLPKRKSSKRKPIKRTRNRKS